jgi:sulfur relay (sulfurtransferase) complex TusBCD TusD component (DsrE family)
MKTAFLIKSECFGDSPAELGTKVMGTFLRQLSTQKNKPDVLFFYGSGVRLVARGISPVLDALEALFAGGVDVVCCRTCAEYFEVEKKVHVGRIGGMDELVAILTKYERIVTVA